MAKETNNRIYTPGGQGDGDEQDTPGGQGDCNNQDTPGG